MSDQTQPSDVPSPADVAGRMAGEYRLGRKLGEGGFGAVYEAEHPVLRRRAAVKVLHQVAGVDSDAVLRFIAEAQAASHVRSRHIVDVFSFGKLSNGRHFYVMDLLDGDPLDRFLRRHERVDIPTALQLMRPIAEALDAAHAAGVVHRDLKPQNIFLSWDPSGETVPKLLDFGMAKLLGDSMVNTVSGVPIGTPLYMSPEQARGEKVDGRSDVYALGVLCHEMLTGQVPFTSESPLSVLMCHLTVEPPRASQVCPALPAALDEPILHMLHKQPSGRPASAGQALAALIAAAEGAGYPVPSGLPHLPRPISVPSPRPSFVLGTDTPAAAPTLLASSSNAGHLAPRGPVPPQPREGVPLSQGRAQRWPFWTLLVALAGGGLYLAVSNLNKAARRAATPTAAAPTAVTSTAVPPAAMAVAPGSDPMAKPRAVATPDPSAAPARTQPPAAEVASEVRLTLRGAPAGARVSLDGKALGDAAAGVALSRGDAALQLAVSAPGYETQTLRVVPDQDVRLDIKLKKRPARPSGGIPSDLESPF